MYLTTTKFEIKYGEIFAFNKFGIAASNINNIKYCSRLILLQSRFTVECLLFYHNLNG